jgi:flagellar basal-body rod protein FlgC
MAMDFFTSMEVSASGMNAERTRMNVSASNLANANTTETTAGGPYKRRDVVLGATQVTTEPGFAQAVSAVQVKNVVEDANPPRLEYDPGHPDANADGYVAYPNVNVVEEMVDMITIPRTKIATRRSRRTPTSTSEGMASCSVSPMMKMPFSSTR